MSRSEIRTSLTKETFQIFANSWIGLGSFAAFGSWAIYGFLGQESIVPSMLLTIGLIGGVILYGLGRFVHTPDRVIWWAIGLGSIAFPPFLLSFGLLSFSFFLLIQQPFFVQCLQLCAICFAVIIWIGIDLKNLEQRLIDKQYIEREFIEYDDRVVLRWERKTDIEAPAISESTFLGKVWKRHGLKLILSLAPLSGAGYACARLLDRVGGIEITLLVIAMLGLPLCIFIFSKLACGFYLNVYKVWQIERKTGKFVLFDNVPEKL